MPDLLLLLAFSLTGAGLALILHSVHVFSDWSREVAQLLRNEEE